MGSWKGAGLRCEAVPQRKGVKQGWTHRGAEGVMPVVCLRGRKRRAAILKAGCRFALVALELWFSVTHILVCSL